jgi:fructose-bisphosphate aldolase class II
VWHNMAALQLPPGVLSGKNARRLYEHALQQGYAIPAISVASFHVINAVLEIAGRLKKPVVIQLYHGGCAFMAGNQLSNKNHEASILGAVNAAFYIHRMALVYDVSVILQTDHCSKQQLPWIEGLYKHSKKYYEENKRPLFTTHMLDFSLLPLKENVKLCKQYLRKFQRLDIQLEMEIGATGGEEDGVDNRGLSLGHLYTNPDDIAFAVEQLTTVSGNFTVAASFGNQHGLAMNEKIELKPILLKQIKDLLRKKGFTQVPFVFHGGSGYGDAILRQTIGYGVVKINFNAEIQLAAWRGVKDYMLNSDADFQKKQIVKYYDPVLWLRKAEEKIAESLIQKFKVCKT